MIRAAIYARISSDRDGEELGVRRQIADCELLAERKRWSKRRRRRIMRACPEQS